MTERVHLVSLGCARNDVDSEELLARLEQGGFELTDDPETASAIVVNTCGFIESAKKDSVDTLLAAADYKQSGSAKAVVAVGCMAERYGRELADALPEADAVLGFDAYPDIADRLRWIMDGGHVQAHGVDQFDRAHRHAELHRGAVDHRAGMRAFRRRGRGQRDGQR